MATEVRDFSTRSRASTMPHSVQGLPPNQVADYFNGNPASRLGAISENNGGLQPPTTSRSRSNTFVDGDHSRRLSGQSIESIHRRLPRANTVRTYRAPNRPNWQPGAEPGLDTSKDDGEDEAEQRYEASRTPNSKRECDITVVDFSDDKVDSHSLNNLTLSNYLDQAREDWVACRWICVNGISWDVVKTLARYKDLHKLAIEDLFNSRNRTKADWYTDHCFIILQLLKLVTLNDEYDSEEEDFQDLEDLYERRKPTFFQKWTGRKPKSRKRQEAKKVGPVLEKDFSADGATASKPEYPEMASPLNSVKTLQQYAAGRNEERAEFMESRSPLFKHGYAVSVGQVSIFLTEDTVISFFEHSAPDILEPLLARLNSADTILRRAQDPSMVVQSLIDAIIDLAIPVASAYDDAIGALEYDVLLNPSLDQPRAVYVLQHEISLFANILRPIGQLVNGLRSHDNAPDDGPQTPGIKRRSSKYTQPTSVQISSVARTYFGDVEDHCIILTNSLDAMSSKAENLTSLIFNSMGAYQNESMKQLTIVTIFFLPLTFLTGYFGQNFQFMWSIDHHSDAWFWYIATPVMTITCMGLMRGMIGRGITRAINHFRRSRRRRRRAHYARRRRSSFQPGQENGAV